MARWLEQVRAHFSEPQGDTLAKPTEGAFVGFVGALGGISQKNEIPGNAHADAKKNPPFRIGSTLLTEGQTGQSGQSKKKEESPSFDAGDLEPRIRFARSEAELDQLCPQIQAEFEAGRLPQGQAERLASLAIDTARLLAMGLVNVPVGTP